MTAPKLFLALLDTLLHDPTSPRVDQLSAELAARLALTPPRACLALQTACTAHWPLAAAARLLEPYGVTLTVRARQNRDGRYILAWITPTLEPISSSPSYDKKDVVPA